MPDLLDITYCFHHQTPEEIRFQMQFDNLSMQFVSDSDSNHDEWTHLAFMQCSHCPLKQQDQFYCPIARNIARVVEIFSGTMSTETTRIAVLTDERNYWKDTTMQHGLHGIFGLIMATSGCPHMNFLKPMARFHLPFSTYRETIIRTISMYFLQQLVNSSNYNNMSVGFDTLADNYQQVNQLNREFIQRIRSVKAGGDAGENAIVILDSFVQLIDMEFETDFSLLKEILDPTLEQ